MMDNLDEIIGIMLRRTGRLYVLDATVIIGNIPESQEVDDGTMAAFVANALEWNYVIPKSVVDSLRANHVTKATLEAYMNAFKASRYQEDANKNDVVPMYPNFPNQVAEAPEAELIFNAIMHYLGNEVGVRIMPEYDIENRLGYDAQRVPPTVIASTANGYDVRETAMDILTAPSAWSAQDKRDLRALIDRGFNFFGGSMHVDEALGKLNEHGMAQRENKAWVIAHPFDGNAKALSDAIEDMVDLPSDVMRIAVQWSNGANGISMSNDRMNKFGIGATNGVDVNHPKSFKLTREQRRKLALLLDGALNVMLGSTVNTINAERRVSDQFARDLNGWKRLFTAMHVGELSRKGQASELVARWAHRVMDDDVRSMNAEVEGIVSNASHAHDEDEVIHAVMSMPDVVIVKNEDGSLSMRPSDHETGATKRVLSPTEVVKVIGILCQNPGMYARRIVELLRKTDDDGGDHILEAFSDVAGNVSTRVLVELWDLMQGPAGRLDSVPKHKTVRLASGKSVILDNTIMEDVSFAQALKVQHIIEDALHNRGRGLNWKFADGDDGLAEFDYAVPLSTRFSSGGRTCAFGTRIRLKDYDPEDTDLTIRLFMHWHDVTYRPVPVDLDLSALFTNDDLSNTDFVSYTRLREPDGLAVHSGDITSAPDGAVEFIDVNVKGLIARGYRYVMPTVHSFNGQTFDVIPEAFAGVMLRHGDAQHGEVFDATTVLTRFDLDKQATNMTPFVFDMLKGEMVWLDSTMVSSGWHAVADDGNRDRFMAMLEAGIHSKPMTVRQLAELEGALTDSPDANEVEGWQTEKMTELLR